VAFATSRSLNGAYSTCPLLLSIRFSRFSTSTVNSGRKRPIGTSIAARKSMVFVHGARHVFRATIEPAVTSSHSPSSMNAASCS
jgi:hypothetical protein